MNDAQTKVRAEAVRFGPLVRDTETVFRLWAPSASAPIVVVEGHEPIPMIPGVDGFHIASVEGVGEGARYRFRVGDLTFPDLASRQQDGDTSGWSIVRRPLPPSNRQAPLRPWYETIICEVHIGTVSPEGTFAGLMNRLEHFRDAGYTALEIMPVNDFPGSRNWGYDGTLIFAPDESYGTPEDLRALVDRAHALGLCMILDVVYNHFGEVDNFVADYAPTWFDEAIQSPWGSGINFDEPMVRQFYYENARMWLEEYDFDGLRFDAIHEIKSRSRDRFLGELAAIAKAIKTQPKLIIENVRNSFRWLERDDQNRPMAFIAQWNDDMHHVLDYLVTGDGRMTGYGNPRKDPIADFEKALTDGFVHDPSEGEGSDGRSRGGDGQKLPPDSFITYAQNHDQIGNRADSKRLPLRTGSQELDFVHFTKFLAPQIPLCFMGDEGHLTSGFPFFIDLATDAARAKREDRYQQIREIFNQPEVEDGDLPEPNDPATFESAKLHWDQYHSETQRRAIARFRELAGYRRQYVWPLAATPCLDARSVRKGNALIVTWEFEAGHLTMALNPTGGAIDFDCVVWGHSASTGHWDQHGQVLRLGRWSAVAWSSKD
jgi:maltooligosyltrehalose trehalohydrolase